MSKCYAKLIGGVGNQLFILAAAYAYSRKYDKELIIDADNWVGGQGLCSKVYEDYLKILNMDRLNFMVLRQL